VKVLVVGGGGREHAIVWKLAQSRKVTEIICAPGSDAIGAEPQTRCVSTKANDVAALVDLARAEGVNLAVIGPEEPLTLGLTDALEAAGVAVAGPSRAAAEMEGSKVFSKEFMARHGVPTAAFQVFQDYEAARRHVEKRGAPVVVKADGLAAGKGVIVCQTVDQAVDALKLIMVDKKFGDAGKRAIVEDLVTGEEASYIVFTDGATIIPLPTSQDHKAVFDGDTGPNTGGMGAYSPAPVVTPQIESKIMKRVIEPTIEGLAAEGRPYKGVLYAGLMIKGRTLNVLEFNCRLGDPEAQPLLLRLDGDLADVFLKLAQGRLDQARVRWRSEATVCVVLASGGYPGDYGKGFPIQGLEAAGQMKDVVVFHAGTALKGRNYVTTGGRVLGVTARGRTIRAAIKRAYQAAGAISWEGMHRRTDIGLKAIARPGPAAKTRTRTAASSPTEKGPAIKKQPPRVVVVMGSESDRETMSAALEVLGKFKVAAELTVASAHRTPKKVEALIAQAHKDGVRVIIAGAGMAAHLAGAIAGRTSLPVIGVPLDNSPLTGLDSLLSTVQMPPGVPVATVSLGKAGAKNAAWLALRILALSDAALWSRLEKHRLAQDR
jgi:phosphoribosylamine--glycine ligase